MAKEKKQPARPRGKTRAARAAGAKKRARTAAAKARPPSTKARKPASKTLTKPKAAAKRSAKKTTSQKKTHQSVSSRKTKQSRTAKRTRRQSTSTAKGPQVARTSDALRAVLRPWRKNNQTIALVPTMGALHAGHLSLIKLASARADRTVVSIFINPEQFAPNEDIDTYPRDETSDMKALKALGVDLVWVPLGEHMYPEGFATHIVPAGAALGLESDTRPHFFKGVATVVLKLLNNVSPDIVVFGEKDYQQLCVISQMVADMNLPIEIVSSPTVRDADGLALSSRNSYLSDKERAIAPKLHETLQRLARAASEAGNTLQLRVQAKMTLLSAGFDRVDYVEVRDARTLKPFDRESQQPGRVLAAVWLNGTRLIDNVPIPKVAPKTGPKRKKAS